MLKSLVFISFVSFIASVSFAESSVKVDFKLSPAGKFPAESREVKGSAYMQGDKVVADNVVLPLKSLNSGIGLRDEHMKNKYLNTAQYPDAVLVHGEGQGGKGTGKIKLRGIEKDIQGTYTIKGQDVVAQFEVKLSDFGISGIKYMGVGVNDTAVVSATIPIKKAEASSAKVAPKAASPSAPAKK